MLAGLAKRTLVGTRWEEPFRYLHARLTGHKGSLYDSQTIAIMRRVLRHGDVGVDVGSFEGAYLRHMTRLSPGVKHFAFEPNPDQFAKLVARFPGMNVYPYAVGAEPGTAVFHCMVEHPALSGLSTRERDLSREARREVTVTVETLDRVIPADVAVRLVKVDVEGAELGVFRGGMETLRRNRPYVLFECGLGGAEYFGAGPEEVFDTLAGVGLRISPMASWLSSRDSLSRYEFAEQFYERLNYFFLAHP
jgi:FkbM family methyltransferase